MDKQSTRIGVDGMYVAPLSAEDATSIEYGATVKFPGVRKISVTINNSVENIYADDGMYEAYNQQGDIELSIEHVGLSSEEYANLFGATYDAASGVVEDSIPDVSPPYAVGFRSQLASGKYEYVWLTKGIFAKPNLERNTKSDSVAPAFPELVFKAQDRFDQKWRRRVRSDDENLPSGVTDATLNDAVAGWFSDPDFVPVAIPAP